MAVDAIIETYGEDGVNVVRVYLLCIRDTLSELAVMVRRIFLKSMRLQSMNLG